MYLFISGVGIFFFGVGVIVYYGVVGLINLVFFENFVMVRWNKKYVISNLLIVIIMRNLLVVWIFW